MSIVDPKYRVKDKPKDWVAQLIDAEATKMKDVITKTPVEGKEGEFVETKSQKADGVDVEALFALAKANSLDVSKYSAQTEAHGFAGRFRMTLSNMLRSAAKQRHGLFNKGGTFQSAPKEWLTEKSAPAEPTHQRDGTKIVKPKPEKEAKPAAEAKDKAKPAAGAKAPAPEATA